MFSGLSSTCFPDSSIRFLRLGPGRAKKEPLEPAARFDRNTLSSTQKQAVVSSLSPEQLSQSPPHGLPRRPPTDAARGGLRSAADSLDIAQEAR